MFGQYFWRNKLIIWNGLWPKMLIVYTGFINFIQGLFQDLTKFKDRFIFSGTYIIVSQNIAYFAQSWHKNNT